MAGPFKHGEHYELCEIMESHVLEKKVSAGVDMISPAYQKKIPTGFPQGFPQAMRMKGAENTESTRYAVHTVGSVPWCHMATVCATFPQAALAPGRHVKAALAPAQRMARRSFINTNSELHGTSAVTQGAVTLSLTSACRACSQL